MKKLILLLGIAFSSPIFAQIGQPLKFEGVEELESVLSADKIFTQANIWVAENFRDANSVIQVADKEQGVIVGKGNFDIYVQETKRLNTYYGTIKFTMKIQVKDGKYKYEFYDFRHEWNLHPKSCNDIGVINNQPNYPETVKCVMFGDNLKQRFWETILLKSKGKANILTESLISYMKNSTSENKSDW
jgi:hypothetical protein